MSGVVYACVCGWSGDDFSAHARTHVGRSGDDEWRKRCPVAPGSDEVVVRVHLNGMCTTHQEIVREHNGITHRYRVEHPGRRLSPELLTALPAVDTHEGRLIRPENAMNQKGKRVWWLGD